MIKRGRAIKTLTAGILGGAMLALVSMPALAEGWPTGKPDLSANVALTTDYVFRGISQTMSGPAIQGGFDASWGWWYGGVWGTNVDFPGDPEADLEIDLYTGIKPTWKSLNFDLGVIFYTYPDSNTLDVTEGKVGVGTTLFESLSVGFTGYFADRNYQAYEFGAGYAFTNKWWIFTPSVSGLIGFLETDGSFQPVDYTYWNAGLTLGFLENWSADIRYWDTDVNDAGCVNDFALGRDQCDARVVGTIKAVF